MAIFKVDRLCTFTLINNPSVQSMSMVKNLTFIEILDSIQMSVDSTLQSITLYMSV